MTLTLFQFSVLPKSYSRTLGTTIALQMLNDPVRNGKACDHLRKSGKQKIQKHNYIFYTL